MSRMSEIAMAIEEGLERSRRLRGETSDKHEGLTLLHDTKCLLERVLTNPDLSLHDQFVVTRTIGLLEDVAEIVGEQL